MSKMTDEETGSPSKSRERVNFKEEGKKCLLWALLIAQGSSIILYTNIAALMPTYVKENRSSLNSFVVGCLFSSYQFVFIIAASFVGKHLSSIGRKTSILIGSCLISVATLMFAFGSMLGNDVAFFMVSLLARCIQGGADSLILVAVPSIISLEWPHKNEVYQGYAGSALGFGMMTGPLIASVVVKWLDYFWTQVFFAVFVFLLTMGAYLAIP